MNSDNLKQQFVPKYIELGEYKFRQFLILYATNKLIAIEKDAYKGITPDLELLNYYDQFLILFRREGDEIHLDMANVFRSIAHKVYRVMLKKQLTARNFKFLQLL